MVPHNDNDPQEHTQHTDAKASGYKVEDDSNLEEKDLKRTLFGGQDANPDKPGYESHGMGGQEFGQNNVTTSGDDPANPSTTAGYTNDYFKRNEPLEEHPENQNFKPEHQEGQPDANLGKAEETEYGTINTQGTGGAEDEPQKTQEGTVDNDGGQQKGNQKDSEIPNTPYYTGTPHYEKPDND